MMRRLLSSHLKRAVLTSLLLLGASRAAPVPEPLPRGSENPALNRFGASVVFYAGFDGHALAEITTGSPVPRGNAAWSAAEQRKAVAFEPGVHGQALLSSDFTLDYAVTGSVLRTTGSMAIWIKPRTLKHAHTYFLPAVLHAQAGEYQVLFGRMGVAANRELLYAHLAHAKDRTTATLGSMKDWRLEAWHLLVAVWNRQGVGLSMDGAPPTWTTVQVPVAGDEAAGFRISLLGVGEDTFVYDEMLLLNVALTPEEIAWLHRQAKGLPGDSVRP